MKKKFLSVCALSVLLVGCDNPLKLTKKMSDTTTGLAATSNGMATKVSNTNDNSAKLGMGFGKSTSVMRDDAFEKMENEKDMMAKMDFAVKYVDAFEFQVFNDEGIEQYDTMRLLEEARSEAIKEIAKKLNPYFTEKMITKGFSGTETDAAHSNFYAIASALHYVNSLQAEFRKPMGLPAESPLDLIVQGLSKKGAPVKSLRKFERDVLKEEALFARLIEARHKFIPVMAIARISTIKSGLGDKLDMLLTKWRPTFYRPEFSGNMNDVQIDYISEMLSHAIIAKKILNNQGRVSKLDKKIVKILSNMVLEPDPREPIQHFIDAESEHYVQEMGLSFQTLVMMDVEAEAVAAQE